ncbi:hypothetical protein G419_14329 [Rhodococcus triatomae BKS 15-14]|nr:hypothetical protein G419_14329 [Rhodococcus triatomae BKS 15-14]
MLASCSGPSASESQSTTSAPATSPTTTTTTQSSNDSPELPDSVPVPVGLEDGHIIGGTLVSKDYCTTQQAQLQVFNPETGTVVVVDGPTEKPDEDLIGLHCTVFSRNGATFVAYASSSRTKAEGLTGSEPVYRMSTYRLGSQTPTEVDLPGAPIGMVSTTVGPALLLDEGDRKMIAVYGNESAVPTWSHPGTALLAGAEDAVADVPPLADFTLFDASDGSPILTSCSVQQAGLVLEIDDAVVSYRGCPPGSTDHLIGYDVRQQRELFNLPPEIGLFVPDDVHPSDDYILIRNRDTLLVLDRETGETVISKSDDELASLNIKEAYIFADRLYLRTGSGDSSVVRLPSGETEAASWQIRPAARLDGWTLVYDFSDSSDTVSRLVRDVGGRYPGPWS